MRASEATTSPLGHGSPLIGCPLNAGRREKTKSSLKVSRRSSGAHDTLARRFACPAQTIERLDREEAYAASCNSFRRASLGKNLKCVEAAH